MTWVPLTLEPESIASGQEMCPKNEPAETR